MSKTIKVWQKYKAGIDPFEASRGVMTEDIDNKIHTVLTSQDPTLVFGIVSNALGIEEGSVKMRNYTETLGKLASIDPQALYDYARSVNDFRMTQYYINVDNKVSDGYLRERITERVQSGS